MSANGIQRIMFKLIQKILPLFDDYRWILPLVTVLGVLAALAEGIGIGLFIPLIEFMKGSEQVVDQGSALVNSLISYFANIAPENRLPLIAVSIFGSIVLKAVLSFCSQVLTHWLEEEFTHHIRSRILARLLVVDYRTFESMESGRLVNTLTNETQRCSEAMAEIIKMLTNAIALAVYTLLLLLVSWKLTLIGVVVMIIISTIVKLITHRSHALGEAATQASALTTVRMIETINGMKVIRLFGQQPREQRSFDQVSSRSRDLWFRVEIMRNSVTPVYEVLAAAFLVFILYFAANGMSGISSVLVFVFVLYRMLPLAKILEQSRTHLLTLGGAIDAVQNLLNETVSAQRWTEPLPEQLPFVELRKGITIQNLTYHYNKGDRAALQNIDLTFPARQTTALVGPSGSGKTTLIELLIGLYQPDQGAVLIDGQALQSLDIMSWRKSIALVSQDIFLFDLSVADNIAYAKNGASEEAVIQAAVDAGADEFISALPHAYDTRLGERGVRLSGGQRQRIALARAFLSDPGVLILDEATNSLDSLSEKHIQDALDKLSKNRTVIVIAHRLATVKHADNIVVMKSGRISEQGTFETLINNKGLFYQLYNTQLRP